MNACAKISNAPASAPRSSSPMARPGRQTPISRKSCWTPPAPRSAPCAATRKAPGSRPRPIPRGFRRCRPACWTAQRVSSPPAARSSIASAPPSPPKAGMWSTRHWPRVDLSACLSSPANALVSRIASARRVTCSPSRMPHATVMPSIFRGSSWPQSERNSQRKFTFHSGGKAPCALVANVQCERKIRP